MGSPPTRAPNPGGVNKNCVFDRPRSLRNFVSIRHGRPRPQRCAGGGIPVIINNIGIIAGELATENGRANSLYTLFTLHMFLLSTVKFSSTLVSESHSLSLSTLLFTLIIITTATLVYIAKRHDTIRAATV